MNAVSIGMEGLTLKDLMAIARGGAQVKLTKGAENRIRNTRQLVEKWVDDERTIYGITTGFGALSDVAISKKDTRRLQDKDPVVAEIARQDLCMAQLDADSIPRATIDEIIAELDDIAAALVEATAHRRMAQIWVLLNETEKARAAVARATVMCPGYGMLPDFKILQARVVQPM